MADAVRVSGNHLTMITAGRGGSPDPVNPPAGRFDRPSRRPPETVEGRMCRPGDDLVGGRMTTEHSTPARTGTNGMAIGGLVTAIAGFVLAWFIPILGIVLGIIGVVLGALGRKQPVQSGLANAAVVVGVLAIVASVVSWVIAYNILT
jgi:hypothetical protein